MKRWERALHKQVDIVQRRVTELTTRLQFLNSRKERIINIVGLNQQPRELDKLQKIEQTMQHIVKVLHIVEDWCFPGWPKQLQELYTEVKREIDEAKVH